MAITTRAVQFSGIASGDGECFCFDVDKETFVKLTGRQPDSVLESGHEDETYQIYPNDLLPEYWGRVMMDVKIVATIID